MRQHAFDVGVAIIISILTTAWLRILLRQWGVTVPSITGAMAALAADIVLIRWWWKGREGEQDAAVW